MSALRVAAQPGNVLPRMPGAMMALALTVGLAFGLVAGAALAARTTTSNSVPPVTSAARTHAAAAPAAAPMAAYRQLVADIKVAERRHDFAAQYRFSNELSAMLTAHTIGTIYKEYARLQSSIAAAKADEEYHLASRLSQRLIAICGTNTVKAQLAFCN